MSLLGSTLLSSSLAKAVASTPAKQDPTPNPPSRLYLYGDESGHRGSKPFGIGLLYTEHAKRHEDKIKRLRKRHNYELVLKYSSNDKFKVPFAIDLIHYLFSVSDDLRFAARVFISKNPDTREEEYEFHYKGLVDSARGQTTNRLLLYVVKRNRAYTRPDFLKELPNLKVHVVQKNKLKGNDLIQVADFLTGSVLADFSPPDNEHKQRLNKHKQLLIDELKKRLGVNRIQDAERPGFNVFVS